MSQILAAENTTISLLPDRWEMRHEASDTPAAVANHEGLRYSVTFGDTRRLPSIGLLRPEEMLQVVLGWQPSDQAWHLGLLLSPELTQRRGSRWCELAYWYDPTQTQYRAEVEQAGKALAEQLNLIFYPVPPEAPPPIKPNIPLPELPLKFGWWSLQQADSADSAAASLVLKRGWRWRSSRLTRILWYGFWMLIYIALSIATLTSDLALPNAGTLLPNPQLLPYLGLGTAGLLFVLILYNMVVWLTTYDRIVLDPRTNTLTALKGQRQVWQVSGDDVQSVYVTEVVKRRAKNASSEHGEINVHLNDNRFKFVLQQGEPVGSDVRIPDDERQRRTRDEVYPLRRNNATSQLQWAALYVAEGLGAVPVWYDMRVK